MEHIYHVAKFENYNDELNQIISVETSVVRDLLNLYNNIIGINNLTAQIISDSLIKNEMVFFKKDCKSIELMPYDLIVGQLENDIVAARNQALVEAKYYVSHNQALVTGLMMFDFICINNELIDRGFVITELNREEKYIEILEADDDDLVDKLEIYLNARDQIQRASFLENEYQKYYRDIKQAETIESVLEIKSKFLTRLQNVSK